MRCLLALAMVAACGDNRSFETFEIVGHTDLLARGMNSAPALAGDFAYVGSRIDNQPILIVDISDPTTPAVVGELDAGLPAMSSRELRAVGDTLVVLQLQCDPSLHGCAATGAVPERIELYDIRNRTQPVLLSTYEIRGGGLMPKSPHEFYLRRDADRVLLYVAAPPAVIEVVDITDPTTPTQVVAWNPKIKSQGNDDIIHSVSVSASGERLYLAHQLSGVFVADSSALPDLSLITTAAADFSPPGTVGPHSVVEVPGRQVLLATEEVYPPPYGTGCPWGQLRTVDISDPTAPIVVGQIGVAENDPAICATSTFDRVSFTAHNPTATHDLAFVTWHAAGIQAIDISDPAQLQIIGELRPEPLPAVDVEDPGLGGAPIEMWSYPIIKRGLIYVVDVRNGLYVLRYHGFHEEQVDREGFREGNSSL